MTRSKLDRSGVRGATCGQAQPGAARAAGVWWLGLGLAAAATHAQVTTGTGDAGAVVLPPGQASPDVSRLRPVLPAPPSAYELRLQTPQRGPVPRAVDEVEFLVRDLRFEGAARYDIGVMRSHFDMVIGRRVTLPVLREAVEALQSRYRKDGHFLTRVLIPPQQVQDGVITVQVIEGYLGRWSTEQASPRQERQIAQVIAPLVGRRPLVLGDLEEALLRLNDMPGMAVLGTLRPGDALGASDLLMSVDESRRQVASWSVANAAAPSVGRWVGSLGLSLAEPAGLPGRLSLGLSSALHTPRALQVLSAQQAMPLGTDGAQLALGMLAARSRPVTEVARQQDLQNDSRSMGLRARWPWLRRWSNSVALETGLTASEARVQLDAGKPQALTINLDRSAAWDVGLNWQRQGAQGSQTAVTVSVLRGLDALGARGPSDYPASVRDGPRPSVEGVQPEAFRWNLQALRLEPLGGGFSALALLQAQHSTRALLAGDRMAVGGTGTARGYDAGVRSGDAGWAAVLELRRDALWNHERFGEVAWQPYLSWDAARLDLRANPVAERAASTQNLRSVAVGLRLRGAAGLSADLMVSKPLQALGDAGVGSGAIPGSVATGDTRQGTRVVLTLQQVF